MVAGALLVARAKREEQHADFWLAALLLVFGLNGLPFMLGWQEYYDLWEVYTYLPWDGFWLLTAPLTYFFLTSLTNTSWRFAWRKDGIHLLPYSLYFALHLAVGSYSLASGAMVGKTTFAYWWWQNFDQTYHLDDTFKLVCLAQNILYAWLSLRLYGAYRIWAAQQFSDIETVSFRWLRNTVVLGFLSAVVTFGFLLSIQLQGTDYSTMWWGYAFECFVVYYLSLSALGQIRTRNAILFNPIVPVAQLPILVAAAEQWQEAAMEQSTSSSTYTEPANNAKTKPSQEIDIEVWKAKLSAYFQKEEPYLQPDITLSELAMRLHTNTSVLSAAINTGFGKNFNDFVNQYRVDAFLAKMQSGEMKHFTLLAIAFECGFNSKATFNRAVKKATGKSPSEF